MRVTLTLVLASFIGCAWGQSAWVGSNCAENRVVIVHLFEWKWTDIASECENFLGPRGFCGVQVSPPSDHVVIPPDNPDNEPPFPWWQRYQPVGYNLDSRSGTEAEFIDMVQRCNAVNVRIYPDAVINHLAGMGRSGTGIGGSTFVSDNDNPQFPGAGLYYGDFNRCGMECSAGCCCVNAWTDFSNVRDCPLLGLIDIKLDLADPQDKVVGYLNKMIGYGVAGFRVDAAKHMWPADLEAIYNRLNDVTFSPGSKPFIYNEVIDYNQNGEISVHDYGHLGRVTEFRYCTKISNAVAYLGAVRSLYDPAWGMISGDKAFVFVDNHDNQRGHGGGGEVITFKNGVDYEIAQALTLAQDYGYPRIMSSFDFTNTELGPPADSFTGVTDDVTINADGSCGGGWVCEHRWRSIAGMVGWAKAVSGYGGFDNWWESGNQVAWSRGGRGFFAATKEGGLNANIYTGLPAGQYCNVIQGCPTLSGCEGDTITVDGGGMANVNIYYSPPLFAIHVEALAGSSRCVGAGEPGPAPTTTTTTLAPTTTHSPSDPNWKRTIVYIYAATSVGEDVFLRGGIDGARRQCSEPASTDACAIDIAPVSFGTDPHYNPYNDWSYADGRLDWYGAEPSQGFHNGVQASGTAAAWTTNEAGNPAFQADNQWGEHMWKAEFDMDCSQTDNGWFEIKAYMPNGMGWENDITQGVCDGTEGGDAHFVSYNHAAKCGFLTKFQWNSNACTINTIV